MPFLIPKLRGAPLSVISVEKVCVNLARWCAARASPLHLLLFVGCLPRTERDGGNEKAKGHNNILLQSYCKILDILPDPTTIDHRDNRRASDV